MRGIADELAERGWSLRRDFFEPATIAALRGEAFALLGAGAYTRAAVGHGARGRVDSDVHAALVHWLDPQMPTEPQRIYWERVRELESRLSRELHLKIRSVDAHFALYPQGGLSRRHLDRFPEGDSRAVSAVLYLVDAWSEEDGGQLALYANVQDELPTETLLPEPGLFVCFLSRTVPHEVLPARRDRLSLTAWLRDA